MKLVNMYWGLKFKSNLKYDQEREDRYEVLSSLLAS